MRKPLKASTNSVRSAVVRGFQSAANERLKGLDRLKSQFISDVSHELRTPLTNLVLYLDLLERSDPDRHARYMAVIRAKSDQLVNFTEDILRISRLRSVTGVRTHRSKKTNGRRTSCFTCPR